MYRIDMSWRAIVALILGTVIWRADVYWPAASCSLRERGGLTMTVQPCTPDSDCEGLDRMALRF